MYVFSDSTLLNNKEATLTQTQNHRPKLKPPLN